MKKKRCYYYYDGYCFWHGDTGEVCDTGNNLHDGYCPMEVSNRDLEELANAMIAELEQEKTKYMAQGMTETEAIEKALLLKRS